VADSKGAPWKFVLFSDLHVSAATIDRCIATLGLIRDLSREESAPVVFLGDFWHHRHSLQVRHVDRCVHLSALHMHVVEQSFTVRVSMLCVCVCVCVCVVRLLQEFQQWSDEGVRATLIPGNHDQVCALNPYTCIVVEAGLTGRTTGERGRTRARDQHVWSLPQHYHRDSAHLRRLQSPGLPSLVTRVIRTPPLHVEGLLHSSL
jgi:hypothetical protein